MIDTTTETLVLFANAPKIIPGRPHLSQVYRWAMRGLRGVKLEWVRCGGRRYTSHEALARFYAALTHADGGESAPLPTPKRRQTQIAHAEKELQAAGFAIGDSETSRPV